MIPLLQNFQTVILADGGFPEHEIPLSFLTHAQRIICCDGAAEKLLKFGREPNFVVGDLDSLSEELKQRFSPTLFHYPDQETNDLTKSVNFCIEHHWKEITILGATGKREDHTLGNLSLLVDYGKIAQVQMLTDYGVFVPQTQTAVYESYHGQQVSIFSLTPPTLFTTQNLVYPLQNRALTSWWQGTLNEAADEFFSIAIDKGEILVFREY
jgi:thiamine pyrophosphokinase